MRSMSIFLAQKMSFYFKSWLASVALKRQHFLFKFRYIEKKIPFFDIGGGDDDDRYNLYHFKLAAALDPFSEQS